MSRVYRSTTSSWGPLQLLRPSSPRRFPISPLFPAVRTSSALISSSSPREGPREPPPQCSGTHPQQLHLHPCSTARPRWTSLPSTHSSRPTAFSFPMQAEYFALEGISELMSTLDRVTLAFNNKLSLEGVLLTMYDDRTNLALQVTENLKNFFGEKLFKTNIPRNIRLAEAPQPRQARSSLRSTLQRSRGLPRSRPRTAHPQQHREPRGKASSGHGSSGRQLSQILYPA